MMSNEIILQFRYSETEYVEAAKFYIHKRFHTKFSMAVALIVFSIGLAWRASGGDVVFGAVFIVLGAILFLLNCYTYFTLPQRWYKVNPLLREEYYLQFSDEGIVFRTKDAESTLKWGFYKDVWETDQFYFLLYGKDAFSLIPKRAFAEQEQERAFKRMLHKHVAVNSDDKKLSTVAKEDKQEYVPKSFEPPDWR